jgi:hypothetical protein
MLADHANQTLTLALRSATDDELLQEARRVDDLLAANVMSGIDLSYWFAREKILRDTWQSR